MIKMNAGELRKHSGKSLESRVKKNEIYIILDNVLDTYNIGSMFRLADAVGAKKVFLCGKSEIPPNPRIKKASINTTEIVEWEYAESAVSAIKNLKFKISGACGQEPFKNLQTVAVEQSVKSVPYDKFNYKLPIALIVGNETYGVSKEVLDLCDGVVELPMFGINVSLNVMVSLAIVLYRVMEVENK